MIKLVSDRELNNSRTSHVDQNDKLNMSLLKKKSFTHRVQFRQSMHFSNFFLVCGGIVGVGVRCFIRYFGICIEGWYQEDWRAHGLLWIVNEKTSAGVTYFDENL